MRKIQDLGRRAAALALAAGMTLSVVPGVLAVDADEVLTPPAQTAEQEPETGEPEEPAEEPADSEEEKPAASDAAGGGTELPADSETRRPVVVDPDQLPADSGTETPADSDKEQPMDPDKEEPAGPDAEQPASSDTREPKDADEYAAKASHTHKYTIKKNTVLPTCTEQGYTVYQCGGYDTIKVSWSGISTVHHDCSKTTKKDYTAMLPHTKGEEVTDKRVEPTCTEDGSATYVCTVCGNEFQETLKATGHTKGTEIVEKRVEPTCSEEGSATYVCSVCEKEFTEPLEKLPHTWSEEYKDDDKPGCQEQTESQYCTVCGARNPESRHLSDAVRKNHKFTHYEVTGSFELAGKTIITELTAYCDYGCGEKDVIKTEGIGSAAEIGEIKGIDAAADSLADTVTNKINDALKKTEEAARNAETKEEAVDSLDTIYNETLAAIMGVKIGNYGVIDETTAKNLLSGLKDTMDSVKDTLNDSFLSKDSVQNSVSAIVSAATGEEGTAATKKSAYELLFSQARGALNKEDGTDADPIINNLVLKLAQAAASDNNKEAIDDLTDSLVDDALDLAMDEIMKDEKYAKLLKTKLGAETMDEVREEIRRQLVEDTSFMDAVRKQVEKAAGDASTGVSAGWDDQKVLDRMQANLLPISDMVSNKITELGNGAGTIVDKKVDDTVHKVLPGKLGDWVSKKVGNIVNNTVQGKVNDLNKEVTDMVTSFIKQFTCGKHNWSEDYISLKDATCTENGEEAKVCTKCGKVKDQQPIPATGHIPVTDPAVAPTETSDGLTEGSHCSVCGAVLTAQEVIPMLDPTIDTWFSRAATTEADAKAAGYDSVDAANAALDAALTAAGFDPANAEHFTVQVNSSIGVLPNDRFSESGVTGKLTLPEGTRGKTAQTYYAVQMFTADNAGHKAGDVVVTPIRLLQNGKNGMELTVYSEAVLAIAWKAQ